MKVTVVLCVRIMIVNRKKNYMYFTNSHYKEALIGKSKSTLRIITFHSYFTFLEHPIQLFYLISYWIQIE